MMPRLFVLIAIADYRCLSKSTRANLTPHRSTISAGQSQSARPACSRFKLPYRGNACHLAMAAGQPGSDHAAGWRPKV
jgi:hypothetical protein